MARVVTITAPRTVVVEDEPDRPLAPGEVRIETLYSGISAGTELTAYRGTNPYLDRTWDPQRRLFVAGDAPTFAYPLRGWGYEQVGRVVEVAPVEEVPFEKAGGPSALADGAHAGAVRVGTIVYGTWGHRSRHVTSAAEAATKVVPSDLEPISGILSHMGAIALNGVLDASVRIGERVALFGLGVVGRIVARLLAASGARVIGVDRSPRRLAMAEASGDLEAALDARDDSVGEAVKDLTDGRGADLAIDASGSAVALHEAVRSVAYGARVVAMGFVQGDAIGLRLGEEFHHNRVQLISSQISGVAPELSLRWDRARLVRTVMELMQRGTLDVRPLISHAVPFERAADAFRMLDETPDAALLVVLTGDEAAPLPVAAAPRPEG